MDAKKFDVTQLFNPELALEHAEKHAKSCNGFITDTKMREMAQTITDAGFAFARAQVAAGRAFGDAVQKAVRN